MAHLRVKRIGKLLYAAHRPDASLIPRLQRGWKLLQWMSDWFAAWFELRRALLHLSDFPLEIQLKFQQFYLQFGL